MKISKSKTRNINLKSFISDLFFHICLFTFVFLLLTSCETTEPPPSNQKLTLVAEDASCTEAWLNLKIENISLPTEVTLKQNDTTLITTYVNSSDTTLFIENLLPSQSYTFQASHHGGQASNKLTVTTMDTTSHHFTWETFTIGDRGMLRDVAVINENNIWAVGEIYVNDSTGNSELNNVAHWDGNNWEIMKIEYIYNDQGWIAPLYSIFAINTDDIWIGSNQPMHWNGEKWEQFDLTSSVFNGWINKTWATSNNQVYIVGNEGNMAIYDGTTWQKLTSNTEVDLIDVWGSEDGSVVWACGYDLNYSAVIVEIEEGVSTIVYESDDRDTSPNLNKISGMTKSIWGKRKDYYRVLTSYGVYELNKNKNNSYELDFDIGIDDWGGTTRIRGSDSNNIYFCGSKNRVWHFNGYQWKKIIIPENNSNEFISMDTKEGLSVFVGETYHSGVNFKGLIMIAFN